MAVTEYNYAEWFIVFGDGDIAHFEDWRKYQKDNGEFWYVFFITPNEDLERKYDLKFGDEIDPNNGLCERHYYHEYVDQLLVAPQKTMFYVSQNFLGEDTDSSLKRMGYAERIRLLEKQIRMTNIMNHRLQRDMNLMMTRKKEYFKDTLDLVNMFKDQKSKKDDKEEL